MTVVRLRGQYDVARRDELDQTLDRFGDAEPLALDFMDVESMDTSALRALVRFQNARKEAGRSPLVLTGVSDRIKSFFRLSNLEKTFEIE